MALLFEASHNIMSDVLCLACLLETCSCILSLHFFFMFKTFFLFIFKYFPGTLCCVYSFLLVFLIV